MSNWLKHVAGILLGKAELLDSLDAKYKNELSWLRIRYIVVGAAAGFLAGYVVRGM